MQIIAETKNSIRVKTPAKINLFLEVLGKRPDGFHNIETVMQEITLFDEISYRLDKGISLKQTGLRCGRIEHNLIMKAARLLKRSSGTEKGARMELKKRIPVGAGLGGGSSDAAATFMALNRLWGLGLSKRELVRLSLEIGSDVPFFFTGSAALCTGRGEKVRPLRCPGKMYYVLVCPRRRVSTGLIYKNLKKVLTEKRKSAKLISKYLAAHDLQKIRASIYNRLGGSVLAKYADLEGIYNRLLKLGDATVGVTGSGSGMFLLCDNLKEAEKLRRGIRGIGGSIFVVASAEK
jgi:4-diphosphocytidyl-2-C-methyl-D-erythritol kinase